MTEPKFIKDNKPAFKFVSRKKVDRIALSILCILMIILVVGTFTN